MKVRHKARRRAVAFVTICLLALLALPALAVYEDGTHYCGGTQTAWAQSLTNGNTKVWPPGDSQYTYYSLGTGSLVSKRTHSPYGNGGGYWKVSTDESLNDPGTYPGCSNYG